MFAFYSSTTEFYVAADFTAEFTAGRRVKLDCGVDGIRYASVVSRYYNSPSTYVTIDEAIVTTNIEKVWLGIQAGATGSLPKHTHTSDEGDGGYIEWLADMVYANTSTISILSDDIYITMDTLSGTLNSKINTLSGTLQDSPKTQLKYHWSVESGLS